MSSYIDITLGEIKTRYRVTYRTARAILTLMHHNQEAVEEDAEEIPTFKFESKEDRDDFVLAIREAVSKALEEARDKYKAEGSDKG